MTFDPYQSLISSSFRYLSVRPRSRKELTEYLQKKATNKDISEDIVSQVLSRLEEMDYINDRKFAEAYVSSALLGKPKGPAIVRFGLKEKGITDEIIQEIVGGNEESNDEETLLSLAKKALGRKGEKYSKLPVLECKRKVHDYLLRRGFSASIVHQLVDDYCQKAYNKV